MADSRKNCLKVSMTNVNEAVTVANNRAQYYADIAKQYRNEAKEFRDNAKLYSEQNSDVTLEYVETMRATLERKVDSCVLKNDLPALSEFVNDACYVNIDELNDTSSELNEKFENIIEAEITNIAYELDKKMNKSQITNCITEIPQRIKYTLESGTLTIKAGSVVIVPYGVEDLTNQCPIGLTFVHENFKVYDTQFTDGKFFVWAEVVSDIVVNPTTAGTNAHFPMLDACSMAGMIRLHTDAETMTPAANPVKIR